MVINGTAFYNRMLMMQPNQLDSTKERLKRQTEAQNQVAALEGNIKGLKDMKNIGVERKLELLHTYFDQIAAVKAAYNQQQLMHFMDEAKERGEKIAEVVEKSEWKTAEERREDQVEEALEEITGEEDDGILDEMLDEVNNAMEEQLKEKEELQEEFERQYLEQYKKAKILRED